jgi:hypothetical protein
LTKGHISDESYGWRELFYIVVDHYPQLISFQVNELLWRCYRENKNNGYYPSKDDWSGLISKVAVHLKDNPQLFRECSELFAQNPEGNAHIEILMSDHAFWGPELVVAVEAGAQKALRIYRDAKNDPGLSTKAMHNLIADFWMLTDIITLRPDLAVAISSKMVDVIRDLMPDITKGALAAGDKSGKSGLSLIPYESYSRLFLALPYLATLPGIAEAAFALIEEELNKGNVMVARALTGDVGKYVVVEPDIGANHKDRTYRAVLAWLKRELTKSSSASFKVLSNSENGVQSNTDIILLIILQRIAKSNKTYAAKIVPELLVLLAKEIRHDAVHGSIRGGKSDRESIVDSLIQIAAEQPLLVGRLVNQMFIDDGLARGELIAILQVLPDRVIAQIFEVNIKLARYLKQSQQFKRMLDPEFKQQANELAYNFNRERTPHPADLRLGEDEKNSAFKYLFDLPPEHVPAAVAMFNAYFANDPAAYQLPLTELAQVVDKLDLKAVRKVIRAVGDNPKESLDEIAAAVTAQFANDPTMVPVLARLNWLLSNLFVLQDKLEQIKPLLLSLDKAGKTTKDLAKILIALSEAENFLAVLQVAKDNNVNISELLNLKLESLPYNLREAFILQALNDVDALMLLGDAQSQDIYATLSAYFVTQPRMVRERVYFNLLFAQATDNALILQAVAALRAGSVFPLKAKVSIARFLREQTNTLNESNMFNQIMARAQRLEKDQRKILMRQARQLCDTRQYSQKDLTKAGLEGDLATVQGLAGELALPVTGPKIPHIFYEQFLVMGLTDSELAAFAAFNQALNKNQNTFGQSATIRRKLFEAAKRFSSQDNISEEPGVRSSTFGKIFGAVAKRLGEPTVKNVEEFSKQVLEYLGKFNSTVEAIRNVGADEDMRWFNMAAELLRKLNNGDIDDAGLEYFRDSLQGRRAEIVLNNFKGIIDEHEIQSLTDKLKVYMDPAQNQRVAWRDYMGNDIFDLIKAYLDVRKSYLEDGDQVVVVRRVFEALKAEIEGRWAEYKYGQEDYLNFLDNVIVIEAGKFNDAQAKQWAEAIEAAGEGHLCQKLERVSGYEAIKARIKKIRNWEKNFSHGLGNGRHAEFTDDFYRMFAIGDYRGSTACQHPTYGNDLNRGLISYASDGTIKGIPIVDQATGWVDGARRVVKLKMIQTAPGMEEPVILVEEYSQHGNRDIDQVYKLAQELSQATGLPVASTEFPENMRDGLEEGQYKVVSFKSDYPFEYSDTFGGGMAGYIPGTGMGIGGLVRRKSNREESLGTYALFIKRPVVEKQSQPAAPVAQNDNTTGGVDLRDDFTITVKGEKISVGARPASPLIVDIEGLTPVILIVKPVEDFAVLLR